ncbi:hypothetical protein [Pseudomonas sp. HLT2-19-2]
MNIWPLDFPDMCPPSMATPINGEIFRFIEKSDPSQKDFVSFYEKNPTRDWGDMTCQSRGLSVFPSAEACHEMAKAVPAMRKKNLAVARLVETHGLYAHTPSTNSGRHLTWWLPDNLKQPWLLFTPIKTSGPSHV